MPNSCLLAGSALLPDVVHRGAYQLIVTHRAAGPNSGAAAKWVGIARSRVQRPKTQPIRAIAIELDLAEIWPGQSLVNGANLSRISSF
jgi:hypothetical protein